MLSLDELREKKEKRMIKLVFNMYMEFSDNVTLKQKIFSDSITLLMLMKPMVND